MTAITLAGPSYQLRNFNADAERTVNWMPTRIETGTGKGDAQWYLKSVPGLKKVGAIAGPVRGFKVGRGVLYAVGGNNFYRINGDFSNVSFGTLMTSEGSAEMAVNKTQICAVDGPNGYVFDMDASTFLPITSDAWRGSPRVETLDVYGVFFDAQDAQMYLSGPEDFTSLDPLDFVTAESSPGRLVSHIVKHREVILMKDNTSEVWANGGGTDFPLVRNEGANIEAGCSAVYSLRKVNGVAYWLGRDESGAAVVFRMSTYSPERISTHALEEALTALPGISGATAFCYQQEGLSFYVLNVPGLSTTWVYELGSGQWHERAEWVNGEYKPWRVTAHAYAYGKHIVGDADGNLYELSPAVTNNDGDILIRDRITPHMAAPSLSRVRFGSLQVDCQIGQGLPLNQEARLMLRYSDDGARTWSSWRYLTLGKVGERFARARATMLGAARDRIWHIRVTDDVACDPINAVVNEI